MPLYLPTSAITSLTNLATISTAAGVAVHGTNTNDSAAAAYIGEIITASRLAASPVALTTATAANITSISLTAGDWDVNGVAVYPTTETTVGTQYASGITTTSATLPNSFEDTNFTLLITYNTAPNSYANFFSVPVGPYRISLLSTTTVYLIAFAVFSVSTQGVYGAIRARRVR